MARIKRFEKIDGVSVKVVSTDWGYSVTIKVDEGAYLYHERKTENCAIKFIVPYQRRIAQKSYKIKLNKQSYTHTKLGTPFKRNFDLPSGGTCLVYLSPEFFLSEELTNQYKNDPKYAQKSNDPAHQLLFAPVIKRTQRRTRRPKNSNTVYIWIHFSRVLLIFLRQSRWPFRRSPALFYWLFFCKWYNLTIKN